MLYNVLLGFAMHQHESAICIHMCVWLLLFNIVLFGTVVFFFFISLYEVISISLFFCQWALGLVPSLNNASNTEHLAFGDRVYTALWSIYPGGLDPRTHRGSVLVDHLNCFLKPLDQFMLPSALYESSNHAPQRLCIVRIYVSHSNDTYCDIYYSFNCISMTTNDVEYLFMGLLIIYLPS